MNGVFLLIATFIVIAIILITVVLVMIQKYKVKVIKDELEQLDKEKNIIASTPVLSELSKVETIIKNDKTYIAQDNKCIGCGICSGVCPRQAWEMIKA